MAKRAPDQIRVEGDAGSLDRFNAIEVVNDIMAPSQCGFDVGDDGSFASLESFLAHGSRFTVWLNGNKRLTGRVYVQDVPGSATTGSSVNVVVRTLMADAYFTSADPRTRVEKTSLKDFLLALYAPLGVTNKDFVFLANVERDLMTGVGSRGEKAPANLDVIKVDSAKVNPPETIYKAASKHLKRFGLMHWDTPDGKIFVGSPDDGQSPIYRFVSKRGAAGRDNNILDFRRIADWSDVPSEVQVYGGQGGKDISRAPLKGFAAWPDVQLIFYRPVVVMNEGAKTLEQVDRQARRERAMRSKRKDAYEISIDGWTYYDGDASIPFGINVTADVDVDAVGGPRGLYYVHRVSCRQDAQNGATTSLSLVAPGVFEI